MKSDFHSFSLSKIIESEFNGELYVNERPIGVKIEYKRNLEMKINGLLPENPPFLNLEKDKIHLSYDGKNFETLKNDSGFQIFRILDPRAISDNQFEPEILSETPDDMILSYDCNIIGSFLKFPPELLNYMTKINEHKRTCGLYFKDEVLIGMKQFNIPPSREILYVHFNNF